MHTVLLLHINITLYCTVGLAGTVYFLADLIGGPENAKFPAFEI